MARGRKDGESRNHATGVAPDGDQTGSGVHALQLTADRLASLSKREREVFDRLIEGARAVQIARDLFVSVYTIRRHIQAIFTKLDVHSHMELVQRYAVAHPNKDPQS